MKHLLNLFTFSIALCISLQLNAVTYCAPSAWGHANGVTGGGNATPTLVDTYDELKSALSSSSAQVIVITKSISFAGKSRITCSNSNKTILAKKGVVLETTGFESKTSGIFLFDGCSNIILRNIKMVGPGADDNQCQDLLNLDGATKVWVDHCEFSDGVDGNFDIVGNSDNITVSWCRFFYEKDPKVDHQFSNLIGSNADMKPKDGQYTITFAYNWWDHGCEQRMTRSRHSDLHFLNCYWNSNNASYYIGPGTTKLYIEGCYFDGDVATKNIIKDSYEGSNSWTIVNSYAKKGLPSNKGTVSKPSYAYTAMAYADVPATITNSSCGAGATLTVTDDGVVSSSCDTTTEPEPEPEPEPENPVNPTDSTTTDPSGWDEIVFTEAAEKGTIDGKVFTAPNNAAFTLAVTDTDASKIAVEANAATFGTAEANTTYAYRLKTGGKSSSKNALTLNIPADGTIRIAVRTGSNSATDRTLIAVQNSTELVNKLVVESDKVGDYYPYITATVKKGTVDIQYPINSLNFYAFAFKANATTEPEPEDPVTPKPEDPVTPSEPVNGNCCILLSLGEEPTVANGGIPTEFGQVVVTAELAKGKWENGYLNMGGNADIITFDFSAYTNSTITAVTFDVTIPNWTSEKNTIAYHWNSDENSQATINSASKQDVSLTAPANAKSFTIQRSASTGTRISQVCFEIQTTDISTDIESIEASNSAVKFIKDGQLFILRDGQLYNVMGTRVE